MKRTDFKMEYSSPKVTVVTLAGKICADVTSSISTDPNGMDMREETELEQTWY